MPSRAGAGILHMGLLLVLLCLAAPGWADDVPVSLDACLHDAVAVNPTIRAAELEPLLAEADYLAAQGIFDPSVFANVTFTNRTDPLSTQTIVAIRGIVTAVDSDVESYTAGVAGAIAAGTQYNIALSRTRNSSTITRGLTASAEYEMDLTGSITQPLLKNFGIAVNTTNLRVAELERQAARARLDATLIDTLFSVEQAYWNLVLARDRLRVQQNGLDLARRLMEEQQARLDVGVVAPLAVLQAETGVALREEGVLLAKQGVGDAVDTLRRFISPDARAAAWTQILVPSDAPSLELVHLDAEDAIDTAIAARPELVQLRSGVEQARLGTAYQKNQRLPELNLLAEYGFAALSGDSSQARDNIADGDFPHWLVGFEFRMPWGNRAARGEYRRALATQSGVETDLARTRQLIVQDVRAAMREIATGLQRVQTTRIALELAEQQLAAEEAKLDVGVSTPFDVRQRQDALIDAQNAALEALVRYRLAVANLDRAKGQYLARIGLKVQFGEERTTATPEGNSTDAAMDAADAPAP